MPENVLLRVKSFDKLIIMKGHFFEKFALFFLLFDT